MKKRAFRLPSWFGRFVLVAPFAIVLLYAVAAVSFAEVAFDAAPKRVLALYPAHAPALGTLANDRLLTTDRDGLKLARARASDALRQGPINPQALRTLGIIAELEGDRAQAAGLMSAAFALDRRDLSVSLWLIEEHVRRNDVTGALRHYDIALRTSRRAQGVLFPVLLEAAEREALLPHLAEMIGQGADWADPFGDALVESEIDPRAKVALADALNGKRWFGPAFRQKLLAGLVRSQHYQLAAKVAGRSGQYDPRLRNALELPIGGGPFDWKLANGYQVESTVYEDGGGSRLAVRMSPEFRDSPARVLLLLPPGRYQLGSQLSRPAQDASARWQVACAQAGGVTLADLAVRQEPARAEFSVPANCDAQWFSLKLSSVATSPDDIEIEIDEVFITPRQGQ